MIYNLLKEKGFKFKEDVVAGPTYLMPDGLYFDIQKAGEDEILPKRDYYGREAVGHTEVKEYIHFALSEQKDLTESDGAIKLNDGSLYLKPYITLPESKPTTKQYTALRKWIDLVLVSNPQTLFIGFSRDRKLLIIEDIKKITVSTLIQKIKDLY